jgi:hypothetical protein
VPENPCATGRFGPDAISRDFTAAEASEILDWLRSGGYSDGELKVCAAVMTRKHRQGEGNT